MIFLETKSKRNKKQAEPKKTQTEQTGKWFFKEIVHERINQNL